MSKIYVIELQGCGLYGANVHIDRAEAEASLEKYYSHSGARIIEFDRSTPVAAEAATAEKLIACVPSNWLDPLLTGDDRVKPYDCDKYNSRQIEELLHRIRERMQKVAAAPTKDAGKVFAYSQVTPTDDPDVFEHDLFMLPPGMDVPEGCEPLYWFPKDARESGPKGAEAVFTRHTDAEKAQLDGFDDRALAAAFRDVAMRNYENPPAYASLFRAHVIEKAYNWTAPRAAEELPSAAVDTTLRFALVEIINEMRRNMPNSAWAAQIERLLK